MIEDAITFNEKSLRVAAEQTGEGKKDRKKIATVLLCIITIDSRFPAQLIQSRVPLFYFTFDYMLMEFAVERKTRSTI